MRLPLLPPLLAAIGPALLAGCIPAAAPPPTTRPAPPVPVPAPLPAPAPASDWRDWPVTPGDWRYARDGDGSAGTFAAGLFRVACDGGRAIILSMPGGPAETVTVRTSTTVRTLAMQASTTQPGGSGTIGVSLPVADRLIDAMGFSRGRFTVERAGRAPLVLPAWPEVLRVAEDCRS